MVRNVAHDASKIVSVATSLFGIEYMPQQDCRRIALFMAKHIANSRRYIPVIQYY